MDNTKLQQKTKRIMDAIAVKEPDYVPMAPSVQTFGVTCAGHTMAEAMYDSSYAREGMKKYLLEYDPDVNYGYGNVFAGMGPAFDLLELKMYQWAGQKGSVCTENSMQQYVEKEYLKEDEYPQMLSDFSGFVMSKYLPRTFGALKPLENLSFASMLNMGAFAGVLQFGDDKLMEMFEKLHKASGIFAAEYQKSAAFDLEMMEAGYPIWSKGATLVPFDSLSDNLRGTLDSLADLYENPEYVHAALERFYPGSLYGALGQAQHSKGLVVFIPMHKGMDGFMNNEQYGEFYWPTTRKLCEELIAAGQIPFLMTEGKYDSRLEFLKELPAGKCIVGFEKVDMKEAKRIVGDHVCLTGGFDDQILIKGTPESVTEAVKRHLDICAPGGGYIFGLQTSLEYGAKPENVAAMFEAVRRFGKY